MDTDGFVLSLYTNHIFKEIQNLNDLFEFCNLNKSHDLCSNKN